MITQSKAYGSVLAALAGGALFGAGACSSNAEPTQTQPEPEQTGQVSEALTCNYNACYNVSGSKCVYKCTAPCTTCDGHGSCKYLCGGNQCCPNGIGGYVCQASCGGSSSGGGGCGNQCAGCQANGLCCNAQCACTICV
jgi:hypothetical protein